MASAVQRAPGAGLHNPFDAARPDPWYILQMSDVLDLEFATGLAEGGPVTLWEPRGSYLPRWSGLPGEGAKTEHPNLRIVHFPVLRGAARLPFSLAERMGPALLKRLLARTPAPARSVLVCTTPYFAAVAERWPGPVVYWLTDLMAAYEGIDPKGTSGWTGGCAPGRSWSVRTPKELRRTCWSRLAVPGISLWCCPTPIARATPCKHRCVRRQSPHRGCPPPEGRSRV